MCLSSCKANLDTLPSMRAVNTSSLWSIGDEPNMSPAGWEPPAYGCGSTPMGSHFGVGEFTTHFRTDFSGDWDVHWGYDLAFDPWPYVKRGACASEGLHQRHVASTQMNELSSRRGWNCGNPGGTRNGCSGRMEPIWCV